MSQLPAKDTQATAVKKKLVEDKTTEGTFTQTSRMATKAKPPGMSQPGGRKSLGRAGGKKLVVGVGRGRFCCWVGGETAPVPSLGLELAHESFALAGEVGGAPGGRKMSGMYGFGGGGGVQFTDDTIQEEGRGSHEFQRSVQPRKSGVYGFGGETRDRFMCVFAWLIALQEQTGVHYAGPVPDLLTPHSCVRTASSRKWWRAVGEWTTKEPKGKEDEWDQV